MCWADAATTEKFLFHFCKFSSKRSEPFDNLQKIHSPFINLNIRDQVTFLLCDLPNNTSNVNKDNILEVILFIKNTRHFDWPIVFWPVTPPKFWRMFPLISNFWPWFPIFVVNVYCTAFTLSTWLCKFRVLVLLIVIFVSFILS